MDADMFDQVARDGWQALPRRGVLGLAAGLGALLLGSSAGDAKKKRKKCKKGKKKCGKRCVDLQTDSANCGACGNVCPGGQICSGGTCAYPADQSFIAGACIPRFGCTVALNTCDGGKIACPQQTNVSDARCYITADGQPICATGLTCEAVPSGGSCPPIGSNARILVPCNLCTQPDQTGGCVLPIVAARPDI